MCFQEKEVLEGITHYSGDYCVSVLTYVCIVLISSCSKTLMFIHKMVLEVDV